MLHKCFCMSGVQLGLLFPKLHFSKSILKEIKGLRLSPISKHVCSEIERTYSSGLSPMLPTAVNNWRRSLQITFFRPIQSEGCVMYYWMSWTHLFTDCFGQSRYQSFLSKKVTKPIIRCPQCLKIVQNVSISNFCSRNWTLIPPNNRVGYFKKLLDGVYVNILVFS